MVTTKPTLQALLICERSIIEDDGAATIIRVVDTFSFVVVAPQPLQESVAFPLQCEVFTRWGPGKGEFMEELRLVLPGGRELLPKEKVPMTLPGGFRFQQIRHAVQWNVSEPGTYAFRVYLDGEFVREHPFRVDITFAQPGPS